LLDCRATTSWRPFAGPSGPVSARAAGHAYSYLTTRRDMEVQSLPRSSTASGRTIFEASPLGLDKWLPAVWLAANSKNGISSHELARALGITQKSAWFMLQRIRLAMQGDAFVMAGDRGRRDIHRR